MGEVYRARDTRLERTVAIKILPQDLSDQHDAKERFEREARAISSLNHANICQLYDVGEQNGISYLVMEYLEGETLGSRLSKGPLSLEQLFRIGAEIADGLDRAHRGGVIHRDLKPGNVMLTKSGAKLMDFGLAKAVSPVSGQSSGLTQTVANPNLPLTAQGTVVGTFQYMSPEQVEGKDADARSDIFALGAVLYEMATGRRAFEGKTTASVLAAVLERQPAPISSVQPMTPASLDQLVRTCMAKDPDERWQTAHDVRLQLKQIAESGSQSNFVAPAAVHRNRGWLPWGVAALFAAAAVVAGGLAYLANQKPVPVLRLAINPPENMQFNLSGDNAGPAMSSPDGRYLVFSANGSNGTQLYLRALDGLAAQPIPGSDGGIFPFWSPDSRSIAFFTPEKLKRIDIGAAAPVTICDSTLGRGGSWNQDGTIVAALSYNTGISRVSAGGGTPVPVTTVDGVKYSSHRWPWFLPDGKHFLYLAVNHNSVASPDTGVFLASLDGKENRLVFHNFSSAIYSAGRLLYEREDSLVAQPFDPSAGKFTGDSQTLSEIAQYDAGLWRTNVSVSDNGNMVYASGAPAGTQALTWFDRSGKPLGKVGDPGGFYDLDLSPDGKKLAVSYQGTSTATIWVHDLETGLKSRLTFDGGTHVSPIWSSDGKQIAYLANQQSAIAVKAIGGSSPEQVVLSSPTPAFQRVCDWSPDGRYLLYEQGAGLNTQLWVLPMFGDRKPFRYTGSSAQEGGSTFSPDGRWVAFTSNDSGRPQIYVAAFPWTGAKWLASSGNGAAPRWRSDEKELYYYDFYSLTAVQVDGSGPAFQVGKSTSLFRLPLSSAAREFAPTRDGQRFIVIAPTQGASQNLTLVQNWMAELKKK